MVMKNEKKNKSEKKQPADSNIFEKLFEEKPLSRMTPEEREIAETSKFIAGSLKGYFSRRPPTDPYTIQREKSEIEENIQQDEFKKRWKMLPANVQKELSWLLKKAEAISLRAYGWAVNIFLKSPSSALKHEEARKELLESLKEHLTYWNDDSKLLEATEIKAQKLKSLYPDQKEKIEAIMLLVKKIRENQKNDSTLVVKSYIQAISAAYDIFSRFIISKYADNDDEEKKSTDMLDSYIDVFKYWDLQIIIVDDEALEMLSRLFPKSKKTS